MLTMGTAPFAHPPGGAYNFDLARVAPEHILYLERVPKRIRGRLADQTIVDTHNGTMLHETGEFIAWYLPLDDVVSGVLEPSDRRAVDAYKGEASYYHLRVGDRFEADAAWSYPHAPAGAPPLAGLVAFDFDRLDAWFEEEEQIFGHPRDPYHRFAAGAPPNRSRCASVERRSRERSARSSCSKRVSRRAIISRATMSRRRSNRRKRAPIVRTKERRRIYNVRVADTTVADAAWALPEPLGEAIAVADHISFWGENTEVLADDRPTLT